MTSTADLYILLKLKDEASKELNKVAGPGGLGGLEKAAIAAGAALAGALAAGLASSISKAAEFEKQISAIKAVTGATAEEAEQLSKVALQLGKDTAFSALEAAKGIEELTKGGVSVADVMGGAAKSALDLAAAGSVSVGEAAAIAAKAMALFNIEGKDTGDVVNKIAGFANATTGSVSDFGLAMSAGGSAAKLAGQDFDQFATAVAILGKAGILGSDAGTSLKTMLLNLIPTTKSAVGAFQQLGLMTIDYGAVQQRLIEILRGSERGQKLYAEATKKGATDADTLMAAVKKLGGAFSDMDVMKVASDIGAVQNAFVNADGSFKDLRDIAGELNEATKDLSESEKALYLEMIFGSDAIRAAALLAEAGAEGFDEMAESMGKVTAEAVAAERLNNLAGVMDQLGGSIETAQIQLGTAFLPVLKEAAGALLGFVNDAIIPFVEDNAPAWAEAIGTVSSVLKEMAEDPLPAVGELLKEMVAEDLPQTVALFEKLGGTVLGDVTTKLGELKDAYKATQEAQDETNRTTGILTAAFPLHVQALEKGAKSANELGEAFDALGRTVSELGPTLDLALASAVGAVVSFAGDVMSELGTLASNALAEGTKLGSNIATGVAQGIGNAVQGVKDKAAQMVTDAMNAAQNALPGAPPSSPWPAFAELLGRPMVDGIIQGIDEEAEHLYSSLETLIQNMITIAEARDLRGRLGDSGAQLIQAVRTGIVDEGARSLPAIAQAAESIIFTIDQTFAEEDAHQLALDFMLALRDALLTGSAEALAVLDGVLVSIRTWKGEIEGAGAEVALSFESLLEAITALAEAQSYRDRLGKSGADLMRALDMAIQDASPKNIQTVASIAFSMLREIERQFGKGDALGDQLMAAIRKSIIDSSPENIRALESIIEQLRIRGEFAAEQAGKAIGDRLIAGTTQTYNGMMAELAQGWRDSGWPYQSGGGGMAGGGGSGISIGGQAFTGGTRSGGSSNVPGLKMSSGGMRPPNVPGNFVFNPKALGGAGAWEHPNFQQLVVNVNSPIGINDLHKMVDQGIRAGNITSVPRGL